jgi:exo-beta-1,3-glucanase (GH17 family)
VFLRCGLRTSQLRQRQDARCLAAAIWLARPIHWGLGLVSQAVKCAIVVYAVIAMAVALLLPPSTQAGPGVNDPASRVRAAINSLRFVAYTPTDLTIVAGQVHPASRERIRKDLTLLREDFQGLITYSCADGVDEVPAVAKALGYRALIIGIWDPLSDREFRNAKRLVDAYPQLIVGISVGNETLLAERQQWPVLRAAIQRLRAAVPGVAITTSEPFYYYLNNDPADFVAVQDFLLPSVHPLFQPWFDQASTAQAVDFVVRVAGLLSARTDKPVLIKETGLPSGPPGTRFTPSAQAEFWTSLIRQLPKLPGLGVAYFEAFDHDWKEENARQEFGAHPEEGYWGLYTAGGDPKAVMTVLRKLWRADNLPGKATAVPVE